MDRLAYDARLRLLKQDKTTAALVRGGWRRLSAILSLVLDDGLKAVFLDAGGTLISPRPSIAGIYGTVLEQVGVRASPEALHRAAIETWAEFDALVGRGRDRYSHFTGGEREYWSRYVRRVLERLSEPDRAEDAARALYEAFSDPGVWNVFPEVRSTLKALRDRGLKLGVISNWDSRLRHLLDSLGIAEEFETIVVSCEVGAEKPSPAIFERALEALGVQPHEAFHVGDDLVSDYEGPRSVGIEAVLLVRSGPALPGVRTVGGLDELLAGPHEHAR